MCGIAGVLDTMRATTEARLRESVEGMAATLRHRGPDASGSFVDAARGIALGHRRLSILDLSSSGAQPMRSASGRLTAAYNGEIYNWAELKGELPAGVTLRGHSDTEVMVELMSALGVEAATRRLNGMFAFAVWDSADEVLHLARDRMGEKPLYYGWRGSTFLFASELKALRAFPGFSASVDPAALSLFLRHGYIPGSRSIFAGIHKLPPGGLLTVSARAPGAGPVRRYWSLDDAVERGLADPATEDPEAAAEELDRLLRDAVRIRMHADVPLGAFLSGGIDSSTVVALMQAQSTRPAKTFTIGFESREHDETLYARSIAAHLGTEHTELRVTGADALAVVPLLPRMYDEPFADASQIPTYLVSKLARQHVTVALSGDGGDELFGGYSRYRLGARLWDRIGWLPAPLRRAAARALRAIPWRKVEAVNHRAGLLEARAFSPGHLARNAARLVAMLGARTAEELYQLLVSQWLESPVLGAPEAAKESRAEAFEDRLPACAQMMFLDAQGYLPDDIMTKVDRASMAVSLEARAPLLDHRLVEWSWRLPLNHKVRSGTSKWLLRRVLGRYVPRQLIERPKMGFGVPLGDWLRGPLRSWAQDLLAEESLRRDGLLDPAPLRARLDQHLSGEMDHDYELWNVLVFQAWLHA
jgi:asparagine synthase (glutamine-hydrolysing)